MTLRKLLNTLVIVCFIIGFFPAAVFAEGDGDAHSCNMGEESASAWSAANELPPYGSYYLTKDVTMYQPWITSGDVNLCLNGHAITFIYNQSTWNLSPSSSKAYDIEILGGCTLTIHDHTGGGGIIGDGLHPVVGVKKGNLCLYDGTITGGNGGVYLNAADSSFHMYGGSIIGNHADSNAYSAGGVYVGSGRFYVSGFPEISGNTVGSDNKTQNIYLVNGAKINVEDNLGFYVRLGVSLSDEIQLGEKPVITEGLTGRGTAENFAADNNKTYAIGTDADSEEAVLGYGGVTVSFNNGGGSGSMNSVDLAIGSRYKLPFATFNAPANKSFDGWKVNDAAELKHAGDYITVNENTVLTAVWKDGSVISVHVHQWKVTVDENDPTYATVICTAPELASDECSFKESRWVQLNVSPDSAVYNGSYLFSASAVKEPRILNPIFIEGFPEEDEGITVSNPLWYDSAGNRVFSPVDAGEYTAKVNITPAANQGEPAVLTKTVMVSKAAAPDVSMTGFTDLPLTDVPQVLAELHAPDNIAKLGTIKYRLGEDGTWSDTIPTASASGTYTVFWYFEGKNYENIGSAEEPRSVTATISEKHDHEDNVRFTQWSPTDKLPTVAGNYFLKNNVELASDWTVSSGIKLCLNGNTINGNGHQLKVTSTGNLTLFGHEEGTLTGFQCGYENNGENKGGAVLIEKGGTLTAKNITMTTMSGASAATSNIGAVTVRGTFNMNSGSITDCTGPRGGVCVDGGTFAVSGKIVISNNTFTDLGTNNISNVYLPKDSFITVAGALEEESSIGVRTYYDVNENGGYMPAEGGYIVWTRGYNDYMPGKNPSAYFSNDYAYNPEWYTLTLAENGEVILARHKHNYVLSADEENDIITVKCTNPWCKYETNKAYTATLTAANAAYDGEGHGAEATSTIPVNMEDIVVHDISYQNSDGTQANLTANSKRPYMPGDYKAILTVHVWGDLEHAVTVETEFTISAPVLPTAGVTVTPKENLAFTGQDQALVSFSDWKPEENDYLGVYYSVDNPNPNSWKYYYKNPPQQYTNTLPMAKDVGKHTVYYYMPGSDDIDDGYIGLGSSTEPLSVEVVIRPRYKVTFATNLGNIHMNPVYLVPEDDQTEVSYELPVQIIDAYNTETNGFAGWQIGDDTAHLKSPGEIITVSSDITITAIIRDLCTIGYNNEAGHGTVIGPNKAAAGAKVELNVTPEEGYYLESLSVKYSSASVQVTKVDETHYTFIMPENVSSTDYVNVVTLFKKNPHTIQVADNISHGTITPTKTVASEGDYVFIDVQPDEGYELKTISYTRDDGVHVEIEKNSSGNYSFIMPDINVVINAEFSKIPVHVTSVTLDHDSMEMTAGDTVSLKAEVLPADADDPSVVWGSSNENAAAVDQEGKVTAVSAGTADITVTTTDGGKKATCTVTVKAKRFKVKFVDEDGTTVLLAEKEYEDGTAAADIVKPADPVKKADAQYTYTFAGWDPEITEVTADAVYTAKYDRKEKTTPAQPEKPDDSSQTEPTKPGDSSQTEPTKPGDSSQTEPTKPGDSSQEETQAADSGEAAPLSPEKAPTVKATDKALAKITGNGDPKDSTFGLLQAKAKKITKNSVTLSWTKVKGAQGYIIYGNQCGKKNKYLKLATIKKGKTISKKITKIKKTKLKKGTFYKFIVAAYAKDSKGAQKVIAASKSVHFITKGSKKYGDFTSVKIRNVKKNKLMLKAGKKFQLKAVQVKPKKLKVKQHRKLAFESSNKNVAAVTRSGKITAKKAGSCSIYAYAQNGIFAKIIVTVK